MNPAKAPAPVGPNTTPAPASAAKTPGPAGVTKKPVPLGVAKIPAPAGPGPQVPHVTGTTVVAAKPEMRPGAAPGVPVRTAAVSPKAPPAVTGVRPVAHLDEGLTYQYNALGRRDPFQPLVGSGFVAADMGGKAAPDIGGIRVVGIIWGTEDKFALVEDGRGNSLVLRPGDKVMNGVVEDLKRDALIVNLTVDGQSQSVAIPLTRKGDDSNANR